VSSRLGVTAVAGSLLLAFAGGAAAAEPQARSAQGCVPSKNLEAIVDDSGSMSYNDPNNLRVRAMELLIDTPGNEARTLGAVEFGTSANPLFAPALIGPNRTTMKAALAGVQADNGSTDYNAAFAAASAQNPGATARIFLTDGEHTATDPYADGHRGGPPVHTIGLGVIQGGTFDQLLERIANETGGIYRRATDPAELQSAMFDVNSAIACQAPPVKYTDAFQTVGQSKAHAVTIPRGIRSAQFAVTWSNTADSFDIGGFTIVRRGKVVARGSKVRRLKVTKRRGSTFVTVKVGRLVKGKLRFKVRARSLSAPGTAVQLTTQVSRSKRR
jgi:von Willebrand factor type A domain